MGNFDFCNYLKTMFAKLKIVSAYILKSRQLMISCLFLYYSTTVISQPQPSAAKEYQKVFTAYPVS